VATVVVADVPVKVNVLLWFTEVPQKQVPWHMSPCKDCSVARSMHTKPASQSAVLKHPGAGTTSSSLMVTLLPVCVVLTRVTEEVCVVNVLVSVVTVLVSVVPDIVLVWLVVTGAGHGQYLMTSSELRVPLVPLALLVCGTLKGSGASVTDMFPASLAFEALPETLMALRRRVSEQMYSANQL
jgi:hypothetical protein